MQLLVDDSSNLIIRLEPDKKEKLNSMYMCELAESCMGIMKDKH